MGYLEINLEVLQQQLGFGYLQKLQAAKQFLALSSASFILVANNSV